MNTKSPRSAEFLRNLSLGRGQGAPAAANETIPEPANADAVSPPPPAPAPKPAPPVTASLAPPVRAAVKSSQNSRKGLKHIGGYLDDETVMKVALLRARLKLDNSELIQHAIEDLYRKEAAKKAFA